MNITTFMQEMVKANVPFIFQDHLDGHRILELSGDKAETHQMLFLKFRWENGTNTPRRIVNKLVDKTLNGFSLCEDVYINKGNGFLYTAGHKYWSYSLFSMVILPKNNEVVKQFRDILSEIVRIRQEEVLEEQNLYIKKYVASLPEFWKKKQEDEFDFTYMLNK
jgi:hypothetical protein